MSRTPKYSTKQLILFIQQYLEETNSMTAIVKGRVAEFCQNELHLADITYQTFSRNAEVNQWINDYNERLLNRINNENPSASEPEATFDASAVMKQCKTPEDMKKFLDSVNRQIAKLSDTNHSLSGQHQECLQQMTALREQNEALLKANQSLQDELSEMRENLASCNKQLNESHKEIRKIRKYIKQNIYDPMILKHLPDIQLLSEADAPEVPKVSDDFYDDTDIPESVVKLFQAEEDEADEASESSDVESDQKKSKAGGKGRIKSSKKTADSSATIHADTSSDTDVISDKTAAILEKLENL